MNYETLITFLNAKGYALYNFGIPDQEIFALKKIPYAELDHNFRGLVEQHIAKHDWRGPLIAGLLKIDKFEPVLRNDFHGILSRLLRPEYSIWTALALWRISNNNDALEYIFKNLNSLLGSSPSIIALGFSESKDAAEKLFDVCIEHKDQIQLRTATLSLERLANGEIFNASSIADAVSFAKLSDSDLVDRAKGFLERIRNKGVFQSS